MTNETNLENIAKAEDTYDLMQHISWEKVVKPDLNKIKQTYAKMLVDHILGGPIPDGLTKETLAGTCKGIDQVIHIFESTILRGKSALEILQSQGIKIQLQ